MSFYGAATLAPAAVAARLTGHMTVLMYLLFVFITIKEPRVHSLTLNASLILVLLFFLLPALGSSHFISGRARLTG